MKTKSSDIMQQTNLQVFPQFFLYGCTNELTLFKLHFKQTERRFLLQDAKKLEASKGELRWEGECRELQCRQHPHPSWGSSGGGRTKAETSKVASRIQRKSRITLTSENTHNCFYSYCGRLWLCNFLIFKVGDKNLTILWFLCIKLLQEMKNMLENTQTAAR